MIEQGDGSRELIGREGCFISKGPLGSFANVAVSKRHLFYESAAQTHFLINPLTAILLYQRVKELGNGFILNGASSQVSQLIVLLNREEIPYWAMALNERQLSESFGEALKEEVKKMKS